MDLIAYVEQGNLSQVEQLVRGLTLKINGTLQRGEDCKLIVSGDVKMLNQLTEHYSTFKKDRLFLEPQDAS